jgi:hypothetical protein
LALRVEQTEGGGVRFGSDHPVQEEPPSWCGGQGDRHELRRVGGVCSIPLSAASAGSTHRFAPARAARSCSQARNLPRSHSIVVRTVSGSLHRDFDAPSLKS